MVLLATLLLLQGAGWVGSMPGGAGTPENITVTFLNSTTVKVSWSTATDVNKYDVTYKPTDASYRIVLVVAGNSQTVNISGLLANTQYQVTVAAVRSGKKYRSSPVVFRTMGSELTQSSLQQDSSSVTKVPSSVLSSSNSEDSGIFSTPESPPPYAQVRGVEVGIVLVVLVVWVAAIALFFNRWGKIRMLLPYQPDYKEQLKVPGTGVCSGGAGGVCPGQNHGASSSCPQHSLWSAHFDFSKWPGGRPMTRPRVNSAIYISAIKRDSEFVNYEPFRSEMNRRTRSAENIPLAGLPVVSISGPTPPDQQADQHI